MKRQLTILALLALVGGSAAGDEDDEMLAQAEEHGNWQAGTIDGGDGDLIAYYRATVKIDRIVNNRDPLGPKHVIGLNVSTNGAGRCPDTRYVYVKDADYSDEEVTPALLEDIEGRREMLDLLKLAWIKDVPVAMAIVDWSQKASASSGVKRCRVVRVGLQPHSS